MVMFYIPGWVGEGGPRRDWGYWYSGRMHTLTIL